MSKQILFHIKQKVCQIFKYIFIKNTGNFKALERFWVESQQWKKSGYAKTKGFIRSCIAAKSDVTEKKRGRRKKR